MVGQHIRILKGGRWVHAVDCGDETVLHLAEEAPPPRVRRAYRPEFVAGADAVEVVTHRERTFPAKEIVKRAYSRASDPSLAAMFQDSESFVEWCTTGRLAAARNVAVAVPGVAPAEPQTAPAPKNGKAAGSTKPALKAKAAVKAVSVKKAAVKKVAKKAAKAKPAVKAKPAKAKAPAKKVAAKKTVAKKKTAARTVTGKKPAKKKGRR
jgi:hypothetical protein